MENNNEIIYKKNSKIISKMLLQNVDSEVLKFLSFVLLSEYDNIDYKMLFKNNKIELKSFVPKFIKYIENDDCFIINENKNDITIRHLEMDVYFIINFDKGVVKREINNELKEIENIFNVWAKLMGKNKKTKLSNERKHIIRKAIRKIGREKCFNVIEGCLASDWHMGDNPQNKVHNSLELIFRDEKRIEMFLNKYEEKCLRN